MNKKKKKKNLFKFWLTNNRIYFEVVSLIIFGLASIIVATLSWRSGQRQVEISELQQRPIIHLKKDLVDSVPVLNIYNVGQPAFNVSAAPFNVSELRIIYYFNKNDSPATFLFSLDGYYNYLSITENIDGKIASIVLNQEAFEEAKLLKTKISNIQDQPGFYMFNYDIVSIGYEDIEGRYYEKYFLVSDRGKEISQFKYDSIVDIAVSSKNRYNLEEIKSLNPQNLIDSVSLDNTYRKEPIKATIIQAVEIKRGD